MMESCNHNHNTEINCKICNILFPIHSINLIFLIRVVMPAEGPKYGVHKRIDMYSASIQTWSIDCRKGCVFRINYVSVKRSVRFKVFSRPRIIEIIKTYYLFLMILFLLLLTNLTIYL